MNKSFLLNSCPCEFSAPNKDNSGPSIHPISHTNWSESADFLLDSALLKNGQTPTSWMHVCSKIAIYLNVMTNRPKSGSTRSSQNVSLVVLTNSTIFMSIGIMSYSYPEWIVSAWRILVLLPKSSLRKKRICQSRSRPNQSLHASTTNFTSSKLQLTSI